MGIRLTQPDSPRQSCSQTASRDLSSSSSASFIRTRAASSQLRWTRERSSSRRRAAVRSMGKTSAWLKPKRRFISPSWRKTASGS
ncbi:hypothetical protein D3C75_1208820 [compost metagenome]